MMDNVCFWWLKIKLKACPSPYFQQKTKNPGQLIWMVHLQADMMSNSSVIPDAIHSLNVATLHYHGNWIMINLSYCSRGGERRRGILEVSRCQLFSPSSCLMITLRGDDLILERSVKKVAMFAAGIRERVLDRQVCCTLPLSHRPDRYQGLIF